MSTTTIAAPAVPQRTAPIRGQSFALLVRTELRKALDTRSGRFLVAFIVLLAVGGIVFRIAKAADGPVTFETVLNTALAPVQIFLPILGVLAMTSEWSQRTALTTFTLSPRRVRVLTAKLAAAVVLAVTMVLTLAALSLVGTAVAGEVAGTDASYDNVARLVAGGAITIGLSLLMGAAFGAVIPVTGAALVVFYVLPNIWAGVSTVLFKDNADYVDVFGAFGRIAEFRFGEDLPQTITSVTLWVLVPLAVGLFVSARREVK